ncbi:UDP-glucose 4-epimerase (Vi polysaccharide biosynthesis) [Oceanobacillus iheyensis HTE831]|uniref:UDP-glucose 4-epimerase (Vi polysaccharide biosynthesis) n=1 Tax=Oceanobacillus iheyensis (strain DSM 14371 / CIP 107618 / JCM 11309 / KCTC 3954 / HTE831) TaxID=221109 RepID=Q8EPL9_OCEIH|nr:SDR family oxidoreductase [Oceanobacillus iheyensis]BAC14038.1 UDP-glucose 4-epimerase (Vi polysaccharide biosynthesis) [Oceanobacillus iheyensis HTE831]
MTKYLVTGGAGFVGSNIVRKLISNGESVRLLDNFSTGNKNNIADINDQVEIISGDFTNKAVVKEAMKGVDIILHQGAIPSVPKSIDNPILSNYANVNGTLTLLNAAVEEGVSRFVYAASSSAYGNNKRLPKQEDMIANPMSPYAVSKYTGELYCKVFYEIYGLETISLRYFNVFGPRQNPHSKYAAVIPAFIESIIQNQSPIIYGDGTQSRDFTYIDNVVSANLLAATAKNLKGEVVNIGTGTQIQLNDLVDRINNILGKNISAIHTKDRAGDVKHSLADIQRAKDIINYEPITTFDDGLIKTVEWFDK